MLQQRKSFGEKPENEPQKEGWGGHSRQPEWPGQRPGVREGCVLWRNVERWYLWKNFVYLGTGMAERSVKCLFYGTRNLTLEELSEMVTSNLKKKEMWFPSYFKNLTWESTLTDAARAASFDYGGFSSERNFQHLGNYILSLLLIFGCAPGFSRSLIKGHWEIWIHSNLGRLTYARCSSYNNDTCKNAFKRETTSNTKGVNE